jgi:hypothetical protein
VSAEIFTLCCSTGSPSAIRVQAVYERIERDPKAHQYQIVAQASAFSLETSSGLDKIPGWLSHEVSHGNRSVDRPAIEMLRLDGSNLDHYTAVDLLRQKSHVVRVLSPGRRGSTAAKRRNAVQVSSAKRQQMVADRSRNLRIMLPPSQLSQPRPPYCVLLSSHLSSTGLQAGCKQHPLSAHFHSHYRQIDFCQAGSQQQAHT